jgi:hypothetical protein
VDLGYIALKRAIIALAACNTAQESNRKNDGQQVFICVLAARRKPDSGQKAERPDDIPTW